MTSKLKRNNLFDLNLKVINIGIDIFSEALKEQGVEVIHVDWLPPAGGDKKILELLDRLSK